MKKIFLSLMRISFILSVLTNAFFAEQMIVRASSTPSSYFASSTQVQVNSPHDGDIFLIGNAAGYQVRLSRNHRIVEANTNDITRNFYFMLDTPLMLGENLQLFVYDRNDVFIESLDLVVGESVEKDQENQGIQLEQNLTEGQVIISGYAQPNQLISLQGVQGESSYLIVDNSGYFYRELMMPIETGISVKLEIVDLKGQIRDTLVIENIGHNQNRPSPVIIEGYDAMTGRLTGKASPNGTVSIAYWQNHYRQYAQVQADNQGNFTYQIDADTLVQKQIEITELIYESTVSIIASPITYYTLPE